MLSAAKDWLRGSGTPWLTQEAMEKSLISSQRPVSVYYRWTCGAIIACLPRIVLYFVSMVLAAC